jgi:hypothetical protein
MKLNDHLFIDTTARLFFLGRHASLSLRAQRGNLNTQSIRLVIERLPRSAYNDKRSIVINKRTINRDWLNPHYPEHKRITKRDVLRIDAVVRFIIAHLACRSHALQTPRAVLKNKLYNHEYSLLYENAYFRTTI